MVANPRGVWNILSVDLVSGVPTRLALKASHVKQLTIVKISFVWLVVKTLDVVVYGWKTLSSYRREPLTMQRLPSPACPCPGSWPAASGSSTSFNYGFILPSRRPEVCPDVLYESQLLHRVRQLIYSHRPPQQVQSAWYNSLRAFLCHSNQSDFLQRFPEFAPCFAMYERLVNNVFDFLINPDKINKRAHGPESLTWVYRPKSNI